MKDSVKVQCHEEYDANVLQKIKWGILKGATIIKPTYGMVIHGVSKQEINPGEQSQEEAKAVLEEKYDIKTIHITMLMKRI